MAGGMGILGLLSFLWIIGSLYASSLRNLPHVPPGFLQSLLIGLVTGLAGFLCHSLLDTHFYSVQLGNLMWVYMGLIMTAQNIAITSWDKRRD